MLCIVIYSNGLVVSHVAHTGLGLARKILPTNKNEQRVQVNCNRSRLTNGIPVWPAAVPLVRTLCQPQRTGRGCTSPSRLATPTGSVVEPTQKLFWNRV